MKAFALHPVARYLQLALLLLVTYGFYLIATLSQPTFDALLAHADTSKAQFNFPPREKFGQGTATGTLNGISFALTGNNGGCNGDLFIKGNAIKQNFPLGNPCSPESLVNWLQEEIKVAREAGKPYLDSLEKLLQAVKTAYQL
ncbi:hypothetical protein A3B57_01915 [Microgenomates group bacterium RIFCSPLOWO2_01_FULL_47_10]|nr:MAG: hypothetical protein A3B57_01915 [Microgenomates group bacterium RIFCSPLOWO2_01_FULL_47_10]